MEKPSSEKEIQYCFEIITWPRGYKIENSIKLKIRRNDWLLADMCVRKHPIIALYLEFENKLKFYNFEASDTLINKRC